MTSREGIGGRKPGQINYTDVTYNNKKYIIGTIQFKGEDVKFVFDKDDFDKIKDRAWHFSSGNYISSAIIHNSKKKELYFHNLVMNRLEHPGKGATETVDHINRNGLDNRKENLRIINQSDQNLNQSKKKRRIELPEDSGLVADDIPKHIWYIKPNGSHGERFAIEFKTENIIWKTTASKNISLKNKLESAKNQLEEYYKLYPYLNPKNEDKNKKIQELTDSYNKIIGLAE
jgi:hypothetical protein